MAATVIKSDQTIISCASNKEAQDVFNELVAQDNREKIQRNHMIIYSDHSVHCNLLYLTAEPTVYLGHFKAF